jgi:hypothetical protein
MKRLIFCGLFAGLLVTPAVGDSHTMKSIMDNCTAKWGTDYRMIEYCRDNQVEAVQQVNRFLEDEATREPYKDILNTCAAKWTEGDGYDWGMVVYCYTNQSEAYRRLNQ